MNETRIDYKIPVEIDTEINEIFIKIIVTQNIKIIDDKLLNLKVYINRSIGKNFFSSFSVKIGDSIIYNSKVIKKIEKEEETVKPISSENIIIYASNDSNLDVNLQNLPLDEEVIFTTEFIQFNKKSYEYILLTKYPEFYCKSYNFKNELSRGKIIINTLNEILDVKKESFFRKLEIVEEKFLNDKNKNSYLIIYKLSIFCEEYIFEFEDNNPPKICFQLKENENNAPIIFTQKSIFNPNQRAYIINYENIIKKDDLEINPALFIFLIEKSGHIGHDYITEIFRNILFYLQCLPSNSYYQIIAFGSDGLITYDETPKKYTKENIINTMEIIKSKEKILTFYFGGANLIDALMDIYENTEIYEKLIMPKNIFILTNGEVCDESETLDIIKKNNSKFKIFSIGLGKDSKSDFIENAGSLGKGGFNFCRHIKELNKVVVNEIYKGCIPFITNFKVRSSLDDNYFLKYSKIPETFRKNKLIRLGYIIEDKVQLNNKIKLDLEYCEKEKIKHYLNYEVKAKEIAMGEELFKLFISKYISSNDLLEDKKKELCVKYQFANYHTSLIGEIESHTINSKEEYLKIIQQKIGNELFESRKRMEELFQLSKNLSEIMKDYESGIIHCSLGTNRVIRKIREPKDKNENLRDKVNNIIMPIDQSQNIQKNIHNLDKQINNLLKNEDDSEQNDILTEYILNEIKGIHIDLNAKDIKKYIKYIIYTQDFIKGFWCYNDLTKPIKEKYEKIYEILKKVNNDRICMTILIIYFINKDHPELLDELLLIFKKAKDFIKNETNKSYEEIIKDEGLN